MKKITSFLASALILAAFAGCKKADADTVITVGATPEPHAAILNLVAEDLAKDGYTLKVIEFTDYVTPNEAVESGEIDANYFQHLPYMDSFNKEKGYHLVSFAGIPDGATVAIPNDPTNEGRALLLLQSAGLIELEDKASLTAVPSDITKNAKNLKFREIEAATLPRVLADVDAAVINGNYALPAGLNASKDGLFVEGADSPYVNVLCTKDGKQDSAKLKALAAAVQSQKVKDYIAETYGNGEVVAVF